MDAYSAFLHTDAWRNLQKASGLATETVDGFTYIERHVPRGSYWQSSRCDISKTWDVPPFAAGSLFLRLEPSSDEDYSRLAGWSMKHSKSLVPTIAYQPRQTSIVALDKPEAEILAGMKQKHRYNIKVAQKHEVKIELHHTDITAVLPRFMTLLQQTADRHDFHTHSASYYSQMVENLEPEGMIHIAIATYNSVDVAAALVITYNGVATYLHGASTHANREVMAPYLMHWEIMHYAKASGCTSYDLWGTHAVKNTEGEWTTQDGHASAGTTRFKLGFGGTIIEYPGTFDLVLKPVPYRVYTAIRALRSRKRAFT